MITERRKYKKEEDTKDVEKYCLMYPWYAEFVEGVKETLRDRERRRSSHEFQHNLINTER